MARCKACSAPLAPSKLVCDYCGTRNDVDLRGVHEYTVKVPESQRICPACDVPMQTIDLNLEGTFMIERCGKCMGLFFDHSELEALLEKSVSNVFRIDLNMLDAMTREQTPGSTRVRYFKCPVCRKIMNRINFGYRSGVIIDHCRDHGVWLEGGELKRLFEWKKAGGEILNRRRQGERDMEREKSERERNRSRAASAVMFDSQDSGFGVFQTGRGNDDLLNSVVKVLFRLFR